MSEQAGVEVLAEIPRDNSDAAFSSLMDALAPESEGQASAAETATSGESRSDSSGAAGSAGDARPDAAPAAEPAGAAAGPAGGTAGEAAPTPEGAASSDGGAGAGPADGDPAGAAADAGQAGAEAGAGGAADSQGAGTVAVADVVPQLGQLSTALEERTVQAYQAAALEEVKTEHAQYFAALEKHPRMLVGQTVPRLDGKDGNETLRDAADAKDWQDAVKSLLVAEVREKAAKTMDENADFLQTVHASIALFQDNSDLVPGTKEFDTELANRFAQLAEPYELRVEGKLQGYSIPVQPIVNQLRAQIAAERKAAQAAPAEGAAASTKEAPATSAAARVAKQPEPPQAGIQSKAGSGAETEDFSTLFGTLGLPDLQI